ncbi:hypothetical protein ABZ501_19975 [Streptomyces sp. NPDC019922]|uniref:hypothetical protein n=1 Tax=unclassified Streptomyces TaxID=2593676 RepID=UPI0033CD5ADF
MTNGGVIGLTGHQAFQGLSELLSLNHEAGDEVDWSEMQRSWGTNFPSDYKCFMSVYGVGSISDGMDIARPGPPRGDESGSMGQETANARLAWGLKRTPERSGLVKLPLIAWAVTIGGDVACWLTSGDDPEDWPVVVVRGDSTVSIQRYGMAEFLRQILVGELDECPFDDATLWRGGEQRFLHRRERGRLIAEGFDPWTGLPDEYFDMNLEDFS